MPSVRIRDLDYFYESQGAGEPLVFLSGLGGDHRAFSVTVRHFSTRFQALAPDNRDVGRSSRVEGDYTSADMADDVAAWLDALGVGRVHLVGHSLGALVAQEFALRHGDQLRSLVLASSHAGANEWRRAVLAAWMSMRRLLGAGDFTRATLPWLVGPRFYKTPAQVEGLVRFAERNEWPQDADAFCRQATVAMEHEARGRLAGIRVPTLVVSGARDLVNPPDVAAELSREIPGSELILLDDVGHMPHIEDGPRFREVLDRFLNRLGGSDAEHG